MNKIIKLEKHDYRKVLPLFDEVSYGWDVLLNKIFEGYGFILSDQSISPHVALAFLGGRIIYAGDAHHQSAKDLVKSLDIQPEVLPLTKVWEKLIREVHQDKVKTKMRYYFPCSALDQKVLYSIKLDTSDDLELVRIAEHHVEKLKAELGEEYHIHHFSSFQEFIEQGCGYCIVKGEEICAATIAAVRSQNQIHIQVNTKEEYRQQGLATKTSAALLSYCLKNGINADWDAANSISQGLANKLGYKKCLPYQVLSVWS